MTLADNRKIRLPNVGFPPTSQQQAPSEQSTKKADFTCCIFKNVVNRRNMESQNSTVHFALFHSSKRKLLGRIIIVTFFLIFNSEVWPNFRWSVFLNHGDIHKFPES